MMIGLSTSGALDVIWHPTTLRAKRIRFGTEYESHLKQLQDSLDNFYSVAIEKRDRIRNQRNRK